MPLTIYAQTELQRNINKLQLPLHTKWDKLMPL